MIYFNSTDNHQKVIDADQTTVDMTNSPAGIVSKIIGHNLGYHPNYRAFFDPDLNDDIWPLKPILSCIGQPAKTALVETHSRTTVNDLEFRISNETSTNQIPVYYRIYEDGDITTNKTFDSKEAIEKIIFETTGSASLPAAPDINGVFDQDIIPHGKGKSMLAIARWSLDGTNWYGNGDQVPVFIAAVQPPGIQSVIVHCDATNVYIEYMNFSPFAVNMQVQVFMIEKEVNSIHLDSKKRTFLNYTNDSDTVLISGTLPAGVITNFTMDIPVSEADSLSEVYISRSDDPTKEFQIPGGQEFLGDMFVNTSGASRQVIATTEMQTNNIRVNLEIFNNSVSNETITTPATWTARYVVYRLS